MKKVIASFTRSRKMNKMSDGLNFKNVLLFMALVAQSTVSGTQALAGGTDHGDGAGGIQFPDDTIVLADPYISKIGKKGELHPALINELRVLDNLLVQYGLYRGLYLTDSS